MKKKFGVLLLTLLSVCSVTLVSCGDDLEDGVKVRDKHEYVDLGLPSGTLWATCNIGATTPEGYGDYFAWGETVPYGEEDTSNAMNYAYNGKSSYVKTCYEWKTYKYCSGSERTLTKYSYSDYFGGSDGLIQLDLSDDAAYVNWGPNWRMPTKAQQDELRSECTWTWTTRNGVNGYEVEGPNGKSIFLPAAGGRSEASLSGAGSGGVNWSRTLITSSPDGAYNLSFDSGLVYRGYSYRFLGLSVRPVRVSQ